MKGIKGLKVFKIKPNETLKIRILDPRMRKPSREKLKTVPCKYCGTATISTMTRLCDPCWELDSRISRDLVRAEEIFIHCLMKNPESRHGPLAHFLLTLPQKAK
jgi:hypothetical protein